MIKHSKKVLYQVLGAIFIILAILGIFLPLLPTTPFLLLSAYFFSQSNERAHQWLLEHNIFGPIISDWSKYGVVSVRTKIIAITMMIILFGYTLIFVKVSLVIKVIVAATGIAVAIFLLTRPSQRKL